MKRRKTKKRYINKGYYSRTIIFDNVAVTFKRQKYIIREEYWNKKDKIPRTCFLLDKFIGLDKHQRIDYKIALDIVSKVGINFSYQDIANQYRNLGITKQMVFYLIKKFNIDDLCLKMVEKAEKKLNHNGVIYVECDDGFKNAITIEGAKKKVITLAVMHTGYLSKDSKRKQTQNKRILIQMGNEEKRFNNKNFWTMVKNFIEQNYENASSAKIIVVADGAHKIKLSEKYNNWIFALDKFHVKKKIKDSLRGNKDWRNR